MIPQGSERLVRGHLEQPLFARVLTCSGPGVLTKPDRIEDQQEPQWTRFVTGGFNPLRNGWYCVKQLGTTGREAGLTWDEARNLELEYFENAPGWSEIPEEHRSHLGSRNLASKLGQVLSSAMQRRSVSFLPDARIN